MAHSNGEKRRRKNERQNVRIITSEWVENNCVYLTPRDLQMLKLLSKFPIMNSYHLYTLTPSVGEQKAFHELSQGMKRCNERIRALYDLHCVNKECPRVPIGEGTSKQYVWLDRAGVKILGIDKRARTELPQDYKHKSLILDTYCNIVEGERKGEWDIVYLKTEERYDTANIIPDLTVVLRAGGSGIAAFIEVDRSEKKESLEREKLKLYKEWELARTWSGERWNRNLPKPIFPLVLYVFDESKPRWKQRANRLAGVAKSIGLRFMGMGITTFTGYLRTHLSQSK